MQTLKDLIKELSEIQNLKDKRLAVLLLFLYSEHYALKLCKKNKIKTGGEYNCSNCGEKNDSRTLNLPEQIEKLISEKIIRNDLFKQFELLHKIRNRMIHDISIDKEKIIKWIIEYKPPTNDALKDLLKKENEWTQFYVCVVTAISSLYSEIPETTEQLTTVEKNHLTNEWIFHLK